ncbi:MAG: DUF47 domain-containing protein [Clostridiales bacterium]|nr:DUF47 domain-containing protein [Clostridiales bacterium]
MFRITPKEEIFFDFFVEIVRKNVEAAELFFDLVSNYSNVKEKIKSIEVIEHDCDAIVHKVFRQLDASFITPIDREDIHLIAKELDDITDQIEMTAQRFMMYNVDTIKKEAIELAKLVIDATKELEVLIEDLRFMKKKTEKIHNKIIDINKIENDGDYVFRGAMKDLFSHEKDVMQVIRWKSIYNFLEEILDSCEDVANIIEGIVMKHV